MGDLVITLSIAPPVGGQAHPLVSTISIQLRLDPPAPNSQSTVLSSLGASTISSPIVASSENFQPASPASNKKRTHDVAFEDDTEQLGRMPPAIKESHKTSISSHPTTQTENFPDASALARYLPSASGPASLASTTRPVASSSVHLPSTSSALAHILPPSSPQCLSVLLPPSAFPASHTSVSHPPPAPSPTLPTFTRPPRPLVLPNATKGDRHTRTTNEATLIKLLREIHRVCSICLVLDLVMEPTHTAGCCTRSGATTAMFSWKRKISVCTGYCYACWGPRPMNNSVLVHGKRINSGDCEVEDVLPQLCWAAWQRGDLRAEICAKFGLDARDDHSEEYRLWLMRPSESHKINLCALFMFVYQYLGL